MEKREWLMNERQRTGSIPMPPTAAALATPGATTGEPPAASELQPANDQQRKEGYVYVSTPSDSEGDSGGGGGKLLYCVCCRNGTLSTYASSKALTTPVAEYELVGRKLRARASAKDYAFTLRVSREGDEQEEQEVVTLRFLNEAELRAWHRFALSAAGSAPPTITNP